jgi:homoserine kinase
MNTSSTVRVRVPATSANLGPGFDTLGLAFQLYNFVTIRAAEGDDDVVTASGQGESTLATGAGNIAMIAVRRLLNFAGVPDMPVHLHLENRIPMSRGLGSSAAARVGAVTAANAWAQQLGFPGATPEELLALATELEGHPDNVAAAQYGGLVVSTQSTISQTTESTFTPVCASRLAVQKWPGFVVFIPEVELATKTARDVLPDGVFRADANFNIGHTALLLSALVNGEWHLLPEALQDRLHQQHRSILMPGFDAITKAAADAGAYAATLSGAGPTILAWLPPSDAVAGEVSQAMKDAAAEHEIFGQTQELDVDLDGCVVESRE